MRIRVSATAPMLLAALTAPLLAQDAAQTPAVALGNAGIYEQSLSALTILLVVAVLIESALAVLFNWRVFLTYFSLRGVRTIVSVAVSALVVWSFDLDVVAALLGAYMPDAPPASGVVSKLLTALILSGGSGGVNSVMTALGYRRGGRENEVRPKAPSNKAWIAIHIDRDGASNASEPVQVLVSELPNPPANVPEIAGTVGFDRPSLGDLLLRGRTRFPSNGGYEVETGKTYHIEVLGKAADGAPVSRVLSGEGMRFAPGAIVDFRVKI